MQEGDPRSLSIDDFLPHRARVEEVLGTSLTPPNAAYEFVHDPERPDIRVIAHDIVAQQVLGGGSTAPQLTQTEREDLITQARRQVIIANNVVTSLDRPAFTPPGADLPDTPRSLLQTTIGRALYEFVQRPHPPKWRRLANNPLSVLQSGLLVVSATATGKTVPVAELAQRAGVGKPFSDSDPESNSMLLVVPTMDLLREYLDPDGTLRQWLPGVTVSEYSHRRKDIDGDIKLIVDESVPRAVASGAIRLANQPIRVIDEGHRAGAPAMLRQLRGLAAGRLILCTATPREMRKLFIDFTASTARSAAEQGITRPVRLLTYQHGPEVGDAERVTAQIAVELIRSGRQTGIYCRTLRGNPDAWQARSVAALINQELNKDAKEGEERDYVKVIAGVSGDEANEQAEAEFRTGEIAAYTAIGMLGEGVNVPMDALIIIGGRRLEGQWQVDQIAGRLPRPILGRQDADREGILIEVQPRKIPPGGPLASIWRTYGFDETEVIEQGYLIGPAEPEQEELEPQPAERQSQGTEPQPNTRPRSPVRPKILDELAALDAHLAPPVALRTITIAPQEWKRYEKPPEGSEPLTALAAKYNVPEVWLRRKLDAWSTDPEVTATITYVGVRNTEDVDEEKRWDFVRWYGPETVAYLAQNPPVALAEAEEMVVNDIAEMCGVSRSFIEKIINTLEADPLPHVVKMAQNHRPAKHYCMPEITKIIAEVDQIPVADPENEEALFDLCQELAANFVYSFVRANENTIAVNERRRHPSSGIQGFARHVSKEVANHIRHAYHNPDLATKNDFSLVGMARMAGVSVNTITRYIKNMPESQRPELRLLRPAPQARRAEHMDREIGLAIVEEVSAQSLKPHRVTLSMLSQYFNSARRTITVKINTLAKHKLLSAEEAEPERINLGGVPKVSTWSWKVMRVLEENGMEIRQGVEKVDYDLTARAPFDPSWQYSQEVQKRLGIDTSKLIKLPARSQLIRGEMQNPMTVEDYAASRGVPKEDILGAVATGLIPGVGLFCQVQDDPADPQYLIDGIDVAVFDRHFVAAEAPSIAATVPPATTKPEPKKIAGVAASTIEGLAPQNLTPEVPKQGAAPPQPPAPAQVAPTDAAVSTPWLSTNEAMEKINTSQAALHVMVARRKSKSRVRRTEDGSVEFDPSLIAELHAVRSRIGHIDSGWMRHERLAEQLGLSPDDFSGFINLLNSYGLGLSEENTQVKRAPDGKLDLAYAPILWRRVLARRT